MVVQLCTCDRVTPHPLHHLRCGGDGAGNSGLRRRVPQRRQPAPRARVPVVAQRGRIYHRERRAAAAPHLTYCAAACRSAAPPPRCRPLPAPLCARRSGGCATSGRGPHCNRRNRVQRAAVALLFARAVRFCISDGGDPRCAACCCAGHGRAAECAGGVQARTEEN